MQENSQSLKIQIRISGKINTEGRDIIHITEMNLNGVGIGVLSIVQTHLPLLFLWFDLPKFTI
jgi:hypothetical protein